jgi:hypothetical protein
MVYKKGLVLKISETSCYTSYIIVMGSRVNKNIYERESISY